MLLVYYNGDNLYSNAHFQAQNICLLVHVSVPMPLIDPVLLHDANLLLTKFEPVHEISNNVVCATSKASDQPAHTHSLIRAFVSRLNIL